MIYAAHSRLISSPQRSDGSGVFEHDGFMGRYNRYIENLDSSFCAMKRREPMAQSTVGPNPPNLCATLPTLLTLVRFPRLRKRNMWPPRMPRQRACFRSLRHCHLPISCREAFPILRLLRQNFLSRHRLSRLAQVRWRLELRTEIVRGSTCRRGG